MKNGTWLSDPLCRVLDKWHDAIGCEDTTSVSGRGVCLTRQLLNMQLIMHRSCFGVSIKGNSFVIEKEPELKQKGHRPAIHLARRSNSQPKSAAHRHLFSTTTKEMTKGAAPRHLCSKRDKKRCKGAAHRNIISLKPHLWAPVGAMDISVHCTFSPVHSITFLQRGRCYAPCFATVQFVAEENDQAR